MSQIRIEDILAAGTRDQCVAVGGGLEVKAI